MSEAVAVPTIDLPDGVLARILAGVPLGKCKVAMQSVSKQWERVLHQPEAHARSLKLMPREFWGGGMPACPNTLCPKGGNFRVSQAFLDALVCYNVVTIRSSQSSRPLPNILVWLPQQLKELEIGRIPSGYCQILENITFLRCTDEVKHPLSPIFPRLEEAYLRISSDYLDMAMADLKNIENLRRLEVVADRFADFYGQPACRVHYKIIPINLNAMPEVPLGLSAHLESVVIDALCLPNTEISQIVLDLAIFSQCALLRKIKVMVGCIGGWDRVHICGLDKVPAACESVIILVDDLSTVAVKNGEMPWVRPEYGWQINVLGVGDFFRQKGVKLTRVASLR